MQPSRPYYKELLSGFIQGSSTPEQLRELYAFIRQQPEVYKQLMSEPDILVLIEERAAVSPAQMAAAADQRIRERLMAGAGEPALPAKAGRLRVMRNWWWAAAVLVIGVSVGAAVTWRQNQSTAIVENQLPADVSAPRINRATITMAGGRTLSLDSLDKGLLARQGGIRLVKRADGEIIYQQDATGAPATDLPYNTLDNPKGSRVVDVTLADGSRVWLNAGSTLTYPVAFIASERKVQVNGEAYFEIAKDATRPFYVIKGGVEIKVLGTHFNVNAYDDEQDMRITLLEGSVQLTQQSRSLTLKPGQQAIAGRKELAASSQVNLEAVMAWKNGWFNFRQVPLQAVMRQLERWYDVEVEYQGNIGARKFSGEIQRELSLSEVLEGLQDMGVHFTITGKKLLVKP